MFRIDFVFIGRKMMWEWNAGMGLGLLRARGERTLCRSILFRVLRYNFPIQLFISILS